MAAPGGVPEGARIAASPTLEEGYLAFMVARGRADAIVSDEHFGEHDEIDLAELPAATDATGEEARP